MVALMQRQFLANSSQNTKAGTKRKRIASSNDDPVEAATPAPLNQAITTGGGHFATSSLRSTRSPRIFTTQRFSQVHPPPPPGPGLAPPGLLMPRGNLSPEHNVCGYAYVSNSVSEPWIAVEKGRSQF